MPEHRAVRLKLLAIDTASTYCSVALYADGAVLELVERTPNAHSQRILPMVQQVTGEAGTTLHGCDAIGFDRGPGSFTGLRIGIAVTQGLAYALDLPVVAVSSLEALARQCGETHVAAAIDARMGQVYWSCLIRTDEECDADFEERLARPSGIDVPAGGAWTGIGSGWDVYHRELSDAMGANTLRNWLPGRHPGAADVARIAARRFAAGAHLAPTAALPRYLRDGVVSR